MKQLLLIIGCFALLVGKVAAQNPPEMSAEKLESLRIAFLSKQLELSPAEAEKFWPVYNKYQADLRKTMRDHREKGGTELELEEKVLNLRKQYKDDFTKTIGAEKFDRLMRAERSWGEMLRKELQRRREGGAGPMRPGMRPRQGN